MADFFDKELNQAVLKLILKYPYYPFDADNTNILWNNVEDGAVGIFPLSGAKYLSRDVVGGYRAQFPFRIVYQENPTNNFAHIDTQGIVEGLAEWLENSDIDFDNKNMHLEKIEQTSPVFMLSQDSTKSQYTCTMQLVYEKE